MSQAKRRCILRTYTWTDWVELTKKVYGYCTKRHFPYTIKEEQKLLTKAHKLGLV